MTITLYSLIRDLQKIERAAFEAADEAKGAKRQAERAISSANQVRAWADLRIKDLAKLASSESNGAVDLTELKVKCPNCDKHGQQWPSLDNCMDCDGTGYLPFCDRPL